MSSERPAPGDGAGGSPGDRTGGDRTGRLPVVRAPDWAREQPAPPRPEVWAGEDGRPTDESTLHDTPAVRPDARYDDERDDTDVLGRAEPADDTVVVGPGTPYDDGTEPPYDDTDAPYDDTDAPYDDTDPGYDDGAGVGRHGGVVAPVGGSQGASRRAWPLVLVTVVVAVLLVAAGIGVWAVTHPPAPLEAVPSLEGRTEASAATLLDRRHLVLTVAGRAYDPTAPRGTITGQAPQGGTLREHRPVAVTVSLGPQPVHLPGDLVGKTRSEVSELVQAVGLRVGRVTGASSLTVPSGDVVSTSPGAGTLLPGQDVGLVVSTGKPEVVVPLLSGAAVQSYTAAAGALTAAHLAPSEVVVYSDTVAKGLVVVTDPAPRATVAYGSPVEVEVSDGPHYVTVPEVTGDSVAAADSVLGAAGFTVSGVTGNPARRVRRTSPEAGRTVLFGSAVQIVTRHD